ncbi:hypothetical protein ACQ4PT_062319 [Festuca glaucescens]
MNNINGGGSAACADHERKATTAGSCVPLYRMFAFADRTDGALMAVGAASAVANGMAQPLMTFIFGDVIDAFGSAADSPEDVLHKVTKVGMCIHLLSTFFGGFIVAFVRGWLLALVMLSSIPPVAVAGAIVSRMMTRLSSRMQAKYGDAGDIVEQTIGTIRTLSSTMRRYGIRQIHLFMLDGHNNLASSYFYILYQRHHTGSLGQAAPSITAFAEGQGAAYRMFKTIERQPDIDVYDTTCIMLENIKGDVELKDVYFSYPTRPEHLVFHGFSLRVPSGMTIALVGESGSGKSTVVSLVERFYDPQSGEILIDGVDIRRMNLGWIRGKIGLVSQEPVLFSSTIRENIAYGKDNLTIEEIKRAIEAGSHAELVKKPEGAYSQLIHLQETLQEAEAPNVDPDVITKNGLGSRSITKKQRSQSTSFRRSTSKGSSFRHSGRHTVPAPFGLSNPMEFNNGQDLEETADKISSSRKKAPIRRLFYLNKPEAFVLALGSITAAVHGTIFPVYGILISSAIKTFYEPPAELLKDSRFWASMFVMLGASALVLIPIEYFLFGVAGGKLVERIRSLTFQRIMHQDIDWFDKPEHSSGAIGARLSTDALNVKRLVGDNLALNVQTLSTIIVGFTIAMVANWKLALIITVVVPFVGFQAYAQMKFLKGLNKNAKLKYEEASQVATDAIGGIRTVASFCAEQKVFFVLVLATSGISRTSAIGADSTKANESAISVFEILDRRSKIDSSSEEGMVIARTAALVGERFYDPNSGKILLDGVELQTLKVSWLRLQIGLVAQEPVLFNDTIRANIAYGKQGEASEEEIVAAAEASNAHQFISGLPDGYDTVVGERGIQLSGGQKQHVAIARAIVKDPKVLLLDEATSALDTESERVVQEALDRVMVGRTTVVVAHRLSTVKGADIISVVKNGTIVEKGRHEELTRIKDGAYASLVELGAT